MIRTDAIYTVTLYVPENLDNQHYLNYIILLGYNLTV